MSVGSCVVVVVVVVIAVEDSADTVFLLAKEERFGSGRRVADMARDAGAAAAVTAGIAVDAAGAWRSCLYLPAGDRRSVGGGLRTGGGGHADSADEGASRRSLRLRMDIGVSWIAFLIFEARSKVEWNRSGRSSSDGKWAATLSGGVRGGLCAGCEGQSRHRGKKGHGMEFAAQDHRSRWVVAFLIFWCGLKAG